MTETAAIPFVAKFSFNAGRRGVEAVVHDAVQRWIDLINQAVRVF